MSDLVCQHGAWYAVPNGIDVGDTGLEPGIHLEPATVVCLWCFTARILKFEALQVGPAACSAQQHVRISWFAMLCAWHEAVVVQSIVDASTGMTAELYH